PKHSAAWRWPARAYRDTIASHRWWTTRVTVPPTHAGHGRGTGASPTAPSRLTPARRRAREQHARGRARAAERLGPSRRRPVVDGAPPRLAHPRPHAPRVRCRLPARPEGALDRVGVAGLLLHPREP